MKKFWTRILAIAGLLVLILDTKTALYGASEGLQLCIQTVVPSLFPFFVLSILLTSSLTGESIRIFRPLGRLCGIPTGAESLLVIGVLGGYPAGAQCIAQAYLDGALLKFDAQRMTTFCNLAGPAFLFGIVAPKFSTPYAGWVLWGIHILSAIAVSLLLPGRPRNSSKLRPVQQLALSAVLLKALRIMACVCGWIVVFRVIIAFLDRWFLWLLPTWIQVIITGILDLSNGCCNLNLVSSEGLRFIISSGLLAFGSICVYLQTASVTEDLPLNTYLGGKILQSIISITLSYLTQYFLFTPDSYVKIPSLIWVALAVAAVLSGIFLQNVEKKSSFSSLRSV